MAWKPRRARVVLLCVAVAVALALTAALWSPFDDGRLVGTVANVVDGDTFDLAAGGEVYRVRLWGIDAPDRGEPGRDAATAFLRDLVAGHTLACEIPPTGQDRDRWNRYVRLCRIDGRDIADALVAAGHAEDEPDYSGGRYATMID